MKYVIHNIDWDTSDFSEEEELASGVCVPDLPSEYTFETEEDYDEYCDDEIADILSDEFGFCVNYRHPKGCQLRASSSVAWSVHELPRVSQVLYQVHALYFDMFHT